MSSNRAICKSLTPADVESCPSKREAQAPACAEVRSRWAYLQATACTDEQQVALRQPSEVAQPARYAMPLAEARKQSELLQLRLREDEALKDGAPVLSTLEATCRALGDVVCKRYDAGMNTSDGGVVASVLELQAHCEQAAAALTLEREEKRRLQQLVDAAAGGELHNVFKQAQAHAEKQVLARMLSSNLEL